MRTLRRNKQRLLYSLQSTTKTPVYATDSAGNIKYYTDSDGNKIPIETGEYEYTYSTPVSFYANISIGGSDTTMEAYGIDQSSYDAVLLTERGEFPLTETSVVWFETEPTYKDEEKTIPNVKSADYQVVKVVDSLSFTSIVLRKRTK